MALNKGIRDPKPRATNSKGTNLKSLKELSPKPVIHTATSGFQA